MKRAGEFRDLFMPWAGLVAGIAGLILAHQFGSDGVFNDCSLVSPLPLILAAIIGSALAVAGAIASWRVLRGEAETSARKLIAIISLGCVALFLLAIVLPVIASLVLPPCFQ